jgi:PST family polysaccharide transporter
MYYVTYLVAGSRIFFTILIFLLVNNKDDFLYVPIINGLGFLLIGIFSFIILKKKEQIKFFVPNSNKLKYYFSESLPLFISAASIQLYVNANRVIVGSFLGMVELSYYDLGEKVLRLLKIPAAMMGQSAFPTLSREKSIKKINKFMITAVAFTGLLILIIFLFSKEIILILGGKEMLDSKDIMRILSISALMVAFSQFLGTSRLIIFGFKKLFAKIIASSGLVFLLGFGLLYFINYVNLYSLSWLAVLVEIWVTLIMFIIVFKKNILYEKI